VQTNVRDFDDVVIEHLANVVVLQGLARQQRTGLSLQISFRLL
jgi:hypothetical protein